MTSPSGSRVPAHERALGRGLPALLITIAVVTTVAFLALYLPRERDAALRQATADLQDRASLHRHALEGWVADGTSDARTALGFLDVHPTRESGVPPGRRPGGAHLDHLLASFASTQRVSGIALLDTALRTRATSGAGLALGPEVLALTGRALASGHDTVEIVRGADGAPRVAFVAIGKANGGGAAVVIDDPARWLYPALAVRPDAASTADALLIRLDGDAVLLLTPRRGEPGTALSERVPIDVRDGLTSAAIAGRDTAGPVLDRGGIRIVAAVYSIRGTSWALVTKVDEREVLAPFHRRMWGLGLGLGLVALSLMGLALAIAWGRRRASEAERANERVRLTALFERADDPVLFLGTDGVIREVTRRAGEFYGLEPEALVGRMAGEALSAPEDRAAGARHLARVLAEGRAVFETTHLGAGGRAIPVEVSLRAAELDDDRIVVAVVRDISARRLADEQLRKLSRAVESSPVGIVITDTQGIIEYVNPRFLEITGYPRDETLGRDTSLLKSGLTSAATYREMWASIVAGREWHGELVNQRKDGEHYWAEVSISPLRDEHGRIAHYVGIQEDISDRKRGQEVLRTTQLQLLQAQKMETVGRLAGGVAHDFNNLLTIIHGYGELLLLAFDPGSDDRSKVEEILRAAGRAAQLTRQLLAFSRRQVLEPKVLDLRAVIADSERMLRRVIGEDIELVVRSLEGFGRVKADPGQIEQVLLNLVVNARDAMPGGGRLTLEASDVELGEGVDGISEPVVPGRYVRLAVTDTGQGLTPEVRAHLFEPFFTTKEVGKGTGLGLATVYGIVKQSGGHVGVSSVPGEGATFAVYLPEVDEPLPVAPPPDPSERRIGQGERVLLVEDDDAVRGLAWALLVEHGFRVMAASHGEEALTLAARDWSAIDLLLTDVVMPGMSGHELTRRLREHRPGLPVLLVSGYSDDAIALGGELGPGVRFLQKPFTAQTLAQAVGDVLAGR